MGGYDPRNAFDSAVGNRGETTESHSWIERFSSPSLLGMEPGDVVDRVGTRPIKDTMRHWGDLNSPHNYPGVGHALATDERLGVLPPDSIPPDTYLLQGIVSPYEAVRRADEPVDSLTASYDFPVPSDAPLAMTAEEDGSTVEYYRPDIDERTAAVDMNFTGEWRPNRWNAAKLPDSLGLTSKEGYVLLGTDADFGTGAGYQAVTENIELAAEKPDQPFDIYTGTVEYDDGTRIGHTYLGLNEGKGEVIVELLDPGQEPLVGKQDVRQRATPPEIGWEMTRQVTSLWKQLASPRT